MLRVSPSATSGFAAGSRPACGWTALLLSRLADKRLTGAEYSILRVSANKTANRRRIRLAKSREKADHGGGRRAANERAERLKL